MSETKITFDKLLTNINEVVRKVKINDIEIKVKQYLPVNDKLSLISKVMNNVINSNKYNFVNPVQLDAFATVEIIKAYTDIEFPEEVDIWELYDKLEIEQLTNKIISAIPATEYEFIQDGIEKSVAAFYNYQTSVLGILEAVSQDYSNLDLDAQKIQKEIGDPNNLTFLKDVMTKMG